MDADRHKREVRRLDIAARKEAIRASAWKRKTLAAAITLSALVMSGVLAKLRDLLV